ncbi:MAG: hypothetical protein KDA24_16355, partial [Deltaproteobacteria bacterium]|nr:hypothetical protein [Deltaproteobacteria bacterium]
RWQHLLEGVARPLAGLDLPAGPSEDTADAGLRQATEAVGSRIVAARKALEARRALEQQAARCEQELAAARLALDEARREADSAQRALVESQRAQQEAAALRLDDEASLHAMAGTLADRDLARLSADPEGAMQELAARVASVRDAQRKHLALQESLVAAEASLARARTSTALAGARLEAVQEEAGPALSALAEASDGGGTEADARAVLLAARAEREGASKALERATAVLRERRDGTAAARKAVDEALAVLGVEEAALRERMKQLPTLADLEFALLALDQAREKARSVQADRERHVAEQTALPRPALLPEEAREVLWTLAGYGEGAEESVSALKVRAERRGRATHEALGRAEQELLSDDKARAQGDDLALDVAAQGRRAELWATMRELLGDSQGKRYRSFAQSLTLDLLLAEANRHLLELEPRYRLERAPPVDGRALLALQVVDRDMGDEVRPTSSLSGGESFLVSLALALALSSLSADGNTVGSLFIDEGFGTLDEKTLETALSVLEALQAGGRQVGIISHVQKLAENIGAQVIVQPEAPGLSRVTVAGPGYS